MPAGRVNYISPKLVASQQQVDRRKRHLKAPNDGLRYTGFLSARVRVMYMYMYAADWM